MTAAALALLAQLAVTVHAPDSVRLDGVADVTVRITSPAGQVPAVTPPPFRPFRLLRTSPSRRVERTRNGRVRTIAEYRYSLAPTREGSFVLGRFVARAGRTTARSQPVRIVVRSAAPGRGLPRIMAEAQVDSTASVVFRALVDPDTVFVGQQATYQLGVFVDDAVRDRLRRMEAIAPDMRGLMAYEAPFPASGLPARQAGSRRYQPHVYQRAIFPIAAGRLVIPPARLVYAMPLTHSFFSREESFELRSDSVVVVAVEPPAAGRPADYAGAVGSLSVQAQLDTVAARVGNPLTMSMRVTGVGNVKLFPRPTLNLPWASVVPADERVTLLPDSVRIRGTKEFEWIVTPQRAGRHVLPAIRYAYYDPVERRYQIAATRPETLRVAPGALVAAESAADGSASRLAVRTRYRGPLGPPFYTRGPVWWLLAAAPLPAIVLVAARRPRRSRRPASARLLRRLARRSDFGSPADVRRAFLRAVAERMRVATSAIAEPAALDRIARRRGVSPDVAGEAAALLTALNAASFAADAAEVEGAARDAYRVYRAIAREAVRVAAVSGRALAVVVALAGAGVLGAAARATSDQELFASAVASYERGRYAVAARGFATLAERAPRAPDAWANLGTAAWMIEDTARATLGWQRALRLEPLASDVRDRLVLVAAAADGAGRVPPIPALPLALAAAAAWLVAWGAAALAAWRRTPAAAQRWVTPGVAVAAALGVATFALDRSLAARDLAVVAETMPLRPLPQFGMERGPSLAVGSVARIVERHGEWARVAASDEAGWVESRLLLPLARD